MRNKLIITTLILTIALSGCGAATDNTEGSLVPSEDYDKMVNERDYYKEQYEKLLAESKDNSTEQASKEVDTAESSTNFENYNYFLDELTSDEIVEECLWLLDNLPKEGMTKEDYETTFKVPPLNEEIGDYEMEFYFVHNYSPDGPGFPPKSAVAYVKGKGMCIQMDDTLGIREDTYDNYMETEICLTDFETASKVYDALYEILTPGYKLTVDSREGTKWRVEAMVINDNNFPYAVNLLELHKVDGGYTLRIAKPIA